MIEGLDNVPGLPTVPGGLASLLSKSKEEASAVPRLADALRKPPATRSADPTSLPISVTRSAWP